MRHPGSAGAPRCCEALPLVSERPPIMASSSSRGPMTAILVVVVAAAAGGVGYLAGTHGGGSASGPAMIGSAGAGPVQAKVNGQPIYKSEVDAFIADLGDQAKQMPEGELRSRVL